ncbi:MAG TPA: hypothetical protein VGC36_03780 [Rhizomicrobium sp.]
MRGLTLIGILLVVLGVGALLFGHFSYTETKPLVDAGPIHINTQEDHTVWIPTIAGIVVLLAGVGLVFAGRRAA